MQMLNAEEGTNLYFGDFSCSVVELASCINLVHCLQAKLLQTQLPAVGREELPSASKCQ